MDQSKQPSWADSELGAALQMICAAGENQSIEFKAQMPRQVTDLGKEISGFATSNAGLILLGVADDGAVAGIPGLEDQTARQALVARLEGICANVVKPSITPKVRFAVAGKCVVAAIDVPKGNAPVYYTSNIPYLRQLTSARPMMPDEVVAAVLDWDRSGSAAAEGPEAQYRGAVASALVDVIVTASEIEVRDHGDPFFETRISLDGIAKLLRKILAQAPADLEFTVEPLREIVAQLDIAAHEHLMLDSGWDEITQSAALAVSLAREFATEHFPLSNGPERYPV